MPRKRIDYSNTSIYKIHCNNAFVTDIYISHTTNFKMRKHLHKVSWEKETTEPIYEVMRNNGGWSNWKVTVLAKYECKSFEDAKQKVQYHYECERGIKQLLPEVVPKQPQPPIIDTETILSTIKEIVAKNHETMFNQIIALNEKLVDIIAKGTHHTNYSHNTNSLNKTFNLQFFLNETCKDAMNITDFVDSIKLQLSDLEAVGEIGYMQGISNIITSNLKSLDVTQRPVHCTDKKRETMYVKDNDKWEKEDDNKTRLRKAIKRVANKNIRLLPQFREKFPDYGNSYARISDKYNKIALEAMGGAGNNDLEKEDKIIRNISKCVAVKK